MIPILFAETATSFETNGIGRLSDAISCECTETRNGVYELEMIYPMKGIHFSDIAIRKIIVVKPSANASLQAFRIYDIEKTIDGKANIYAQHISYDLSKNTCMPFSVTAATSACNTTLQALKSNSVESNPFTFWTDVTTVASYNQKVPASIRSRLGGVEGSVLDQFGGEYEFDNYTVKLHKNRGEARPITLRYGKNITDINQDENIASTVTGIVPYWTDIDNTEVVTLPEKAIYSPYASNYSTKLTIPMDYSQEWEEAPTVAALRNAATIDANKKGFGVPKVSIKVSFVELADSEEYKDIISLQSANLCDTITVQFEELGIDTTAEVVETVYDVLDEKYVSLQIGSLRSTLASAITDIEAAGMATIDGQTKRVFAEAGTEARELVDNATAWLTSSGGYVIAVKNSDGSWKELLFMDTNNVNTAKNVLRINENGLGFSSTGVSGPYTQAWTLDGKLVVGGTNVPSITCYDSSGKILFQTARDGVMWNAPYSSMSKDGTLKLINAEINNGKIILKDSSGDIVFEANTSGVTVNKGAISGATVLLGGINNTDGSLTLYNSSGTKILDLTNAGLRLYENGNTVVSTLSADGIAMSKGSINLNNLFKVSSSGAITSTSGTIGGFTIDSNTIRSGSTDSTADGAVTIANSAFSRSINSNYRSGLRLAIGGNFAVSANGTLYASGTQIDGTITSSLRGKEVKLTGGGLGIYSDGSELATFSAGTQGATIDCNDKRFTISNVTQLSINTDYGNITTSSSHGLRIYTSNNDIDISAEDDLYLYAGQGNDIYINAGSSGTVHITASNAKSHKFEYTNEDGNVSWMQFKDGLLYNWG